MRQIVEALAKPAKPPVQTADSGVAKAVGDYWDHARKGLGLSQ